MDRNQDREEQHFPSGQASPGVPEGYAPGGDFPEQRQQPADPPSVDQNLVQGPFARDYQDWIQTPSEHRPVPHIKVVAGHAGKDSTKRVTPSLLTAFELAHGIPSSTLKITRHDYGNPEGVVVAEGREWQPSTYTGHSSASGQTLAAQAHIGNQGYDYCYCV